jgi:hypothetical protein
MAAVVSKVKDNVYSTRVNHREVAEPVFIWGEPAAVAASQS